MGMEGRRCRFPAGLRQTLAVTALVALVIGGAQVANEYTPASSGFSTIATIKADPTGPTGGPGGSNGGMNGSQFQPPSMPSSMPDYQGGNNQPPMDQNSGISIYNTGSPGAQQVPSQQSGQQGPQQAQRPAHGTQIPDYQTATPYTEGPGRANPDYNGPQQNSSQQGQQEQPQTQAPSQQPSQAPTQTQAPMQTQQPDESNQDTQQDQQSKNKKHMNESDEDHDKYCEENVSEGPGGQVDIKDASHFRNGGSGTNSVEDRVLKYEVHTKWADEFHDAVENWKYRVGTDRITFQEKGESDGANLSIMDEWNPSNYDWVPGNRKTYATWDQTLFFQDAITTNAQEMEKLTRGQRVSVFAHEIGHALGLDHSCRGALMYYTLNTPFASIGPEAMDMAMFNMIWPKLN